MAHVFLRALALFGISLSLNAQLTTVKEWRESMAATKPADKESAMLSGLLLKSMGDGFVWSNAMLKKRNSANNCTALPRNSA
jgi:hypothetical protein